MKKTSLTALLFSLLMLNWYWASQDNANGANKEPHEIESAPKPDTEEGKGSFFVRVRGTECRYFPDKEFPFCCHNSIQSLCAKDDLYNALTNLAISKELLDVNARFTDAACQVLESDIDFPIKCEGPNDRAFLKMDVLNEVIRIGKEKK